MFAVIDRFEGMFAVLEMEDKSTVNIKRDAVPHGAKEGDVLSIDGGKIIIDMEETVKRRSEAEKMMDEMWK